MIKNNSSLTNLKFFFLNIIWFPKIPRMEDKYKRGWLGEKKKHSAMSLFFKKPPEERKGINKLEILKN